MSRVCEITGKKAIVGNKVSHSNTKTKRKFNVNLKVKKFFLPAENKWITLRISTSALRTINKNGIDGEKENRFFSGYCWVHAGFHRLQAQNPLADDYFCLSAQVDFWCVDPRLHENGNWRTLCRHCRH